MIGISRQLSPRSVRHAALVAVIGLGTLAGTARPATAQVSIPSINGPKQAALRAAAAANAHTAAMQNVDQTPTPSRPAAAPTASRPLASKPIMSKSVSGSTGRVTPAAESEAKAIPSAASHAAAVAAAPAAGAARGAKGKGATPGGPPDAVAGGPQSAMGDSAGNSISVTQRGVRGEVSLNREVFSYDPGARRDPFISLMRSGDLRPMLSDLRLGTVLYDPTGQNSIAVMRDISTKDQYVVRVGQTLGRMRVVQIQPKQVVFTIEEVGFSREEALALGDTTKARTP